MINILMNQKRGLNRISKLPYDGDPWAPNSSGAKEKHLLDPGGQYNMKERSALGHQMQRCNIFMFIVVLRIAFILLTDTLMAIYFPAFTPNLVYIPNFHQICVNVFFPEQIKWVDVNVRAVMILSNGRNLICLSKCILNMILN